MRYDEPMHGIQTVLKPIITTHRRILTKIPGESFKMYNFSLKDFLSILLDTRSKSIKHKFKDIFFHALLLLLPITLFHDSLTHVFELPKHELLLVTRVKHT